MRLLWLLLLLGAGPSFACAILDPEEQRRRDRDDVALQLHLSESLARQAEVIFIGYVAGIDKAGSSAHVAVERVLKGKTEASVHLPANDPKGLTVSCWASDMFRNSQVLAGRRYIFYLQGEAVLRAGWTERRSGELSLRSEKRAVRQVNGT